MLESQTTVEALAAFACDTRLEDVDAGAVQAAELLLVDAVACALAGHQGGQIREATGLARAIGGQGTTTVIGSDERLSLGGATLLNSYLVTGVNACDIYEPAFTHVTPLVVPPAVAIAEREGRSGAELVEAVLLGAEVVTRIGRALDFAAFEERGWQAPGVIGPFGGAVAAGRLLGLDHGLMANAIALAGSQAAGTASDWGTPANKFHQFRGALSGLTAALLAAEGMPAGRGVLDAGRGGLYQTYAPGRPEAVVDALASHWEIGRIGLRRWPTASGIQGVVTAVMEALAEGVAPTEITDVQVDVSPQVFGRHGTVARPDTKFQRLQSIHYITAVALVDGRLWLEQFDDERAAGADVAALLDVVTVAEDPGIGGAGAKVRVRAGDREVTAACAAPKGHPTNPLNRTDIEEKLRTAGRARLPEAALSAALVQLASPGELDDVAALLAHLRPSGEM